MAQHIQETKPNEKNIQRAPDMYSELRTEVDRLFDNFIGRNIRGWPTLFGNGSGPSLSVDVTENDTHVTVEAEVPGMAEKDIKITLRDGVLTLKGEKKTEREEEKDNYYLSERSFGSFERTIRLPDTIDENKVEAKVDNGVLKVTLAKRADTIKPAKQIPIGKK